MDKLPNILLLCSDQHHPRLAGCYGNPVVDTPNIDRLSKEGVRFDSAYCNCPLCVPSRMSFLTGRYPHNCDVFRNTDILASDQPTFAHLASRQGYYPVLSGRMHFPGPDQRHGFLERLVGDVWPYAAFGPDLNTFAPLPPRLGHMTHPNPLLTVGAGSSYYLKFDEDVTRESCRWLRNYAAKSPRNPFLMTVGWVNPHCPYIAPPELYDKYFSIVETSELEPAELGRLHPYHQAYRKDIDISSIPAENFRKATAAYYALVEFIDRQLGILLSCLETESILDNTIVIYTSDHGEMLGEHGRWHKGCFYESSAGVPLLIRFPEHFKYAGKAISSPVSLVDLLPSLTDWMQVEQKLSGDGQSWEPLLNGSDEQTLPVFSEFYDFNGHSNRMVRLGPWKLNFYEAYEKGELFNLENDPEELINLWDNPNCKTTVEELTNLIFSEGWSPQLFASHLESRDNREASIVWEAADLLLNDAEILAGITDFRPPDPAENWLR